MVKNTQWETINKIKILARMWNNGLTFRALSTDDWQVSISPMQLWVKKALCAFPNQKCTVYCFLCIRVILLMAPLLYKIYKIRLKLHQTPARHWTTALKPELWIFLVKVGQLIILVVTLLTSEPYRIQCCSNFIYLVHPQVVLSWYSNSFYLGPLDNPTPSIGSPWSFPNIYKSESVET